MPDNQRTTTHEMLMLSELLRMETSDAEKVHAMLPMIGDAELKAELSSCVATSQKHIKALVDYCEGQGITQ